MIYLLFLSSGGIAMLLFSTLFLVRQDHILSFPNPFSYRNLVISSNIFSSYQVLIQFFFFSIGVRPEVVLPCSSFLTECSQLRHLHCILFSKWLDLFKVLWFSLVCQRSNLVLPLLFLFRCPSGSILDLRPRSSCSGGVL